MAMASALVQSTSSSSSSASSSPRRRTNGRRKVEPEAVTILMEIPGIPSKTQLKSWLYSARELTTGDETWSYIRDYIRNSQEHGFGVKVLSVVRIVRRGDYELEHDQDKKNKFRMMLWHGTKTDCVAKILQSGIQNPPAKNQMFGTGIYFADRVSKSCQYTTPTPTPSRPTKDSTGYLFLCDVLIGKAYTARKARNGATSPPPIVKKDGTQVACDSVMCHGENVPNRDQQIKYKGSVWPIGETIRNPKFPSYTIRYNEYIVYDPKNVKPKYLVKVKFVGDKYMF